MLTLGLGLGLKQFPLTVSYAITVHKSRSITVDKMVPDLSDRDFQTGLSYVVVSRVKMLEGSNLTRQVGQCNA
ncbi:hypothetical protein CEP52_017723 [Fusarium oligoseptatum]|uniref:ATP-dependent DNA helicase PIF1 n=1 Tax=Fusarium oligoseptatum TaxID=2604345 RepID=A0A428RIK9_9HYPO|nr:hypothetical protein CEP52_017723 [Fusarium oligoseptatum]